MAIRTSLCVGLASVGLAVIAAQPQLFSQETLSSRILKWSESDQTAWLHSYLDQGMPPSDVAVMLVLNKSSLALPMIEAKIEEVLQSTSPLECFANKEVDPTYFVDIAATTISDAANEQSLRTLAKLIRIDDKRFGDLVQLALLHAQNRGNPFTLAYRGLEMGDPALDQKIAAWVEQSLADKDPYGVIKLKHLWADALLNKYRGLPVSSEWANDPIVSRLKESQSAALQDEMFRLVSEAIGKRATK